ncbi:hypothetical protein D3C72_2012710 [compost metagenome]
MDEVLGDLVQVLAVERCAGIGGDVDRAGGFCAGRIQGMEPAVAGKPDVLAVPGHAMDALDVGKGSVFTKYVGG